MTKHAKYTPTSPQCQIPPYMREAACAMFYCKYKEIKRIERPDQVKLEFSEGCKGDPVLNAAYDSFMSAYSCDGYLQDLPRGLTRRQFRNMITSYWQAWKKTRHCPSQPHKRVIQLSHAEAVELATHLIEPVNRNGSMERFETVKDAMKVKPRVEELVKKSGVGDITSSLDTWLLREVPWLKLQPDDCAPRLCKSTLQKRVQCSDVWGGRIPWRRIRRRHGYAKDRARKKQEKSPITRKRRRSTDEEKDDDDDDMLDCFFDPAWFGPFTFMLDATRLELREGTVQDVSTVFMSSEHVFGPRLGEPDASISQTQSLMVYALIHKYHGLLVGPDVMLTGSKLKASASQSTKSDQFQEQGVETW